MVNTMNQQERGKSSDITNEERKGNRNGLDGSPVEVWKCLGEEGIDMSKRKYQRSGEIV